MWGCGGMDGAPCLNSRVARTGSVIRCRDSKGEAMSKSYRVALLLVLVAVSFTGALTKLARAAESRDESEIRQLLLMQTDAWNRGDIDSFMTGYWKSDETAFVGGNGITRGWQAVLDRYKRNYPDREAMGHLTFSELEVHLTCPDAAFAIGQFQLQRESDKTPRIFTLGFPTISDS